MPYVPQMPKNPDPKGSVDNSMPEFMTDMRSERALYGMEPLTEAAKAKNRLIMAKKDNNTRK